MPTPPGRAMESFCFGGNLLPLPYYHNRILKFSVGFVIHLLFRLLNYEATLIGPPATKHENDGLQIVKSNLLKNRRSVSLSFRQAPCRSFFSDATWLPSRSREKYPVRWPSV